MPDDINMTDQNLLFCEEVFSARDPLLFLPRDITHQADYSRFYLRESYITNWFPPYSYPEAVQY